MNLLRNQYVANVLNRNVDGSNKAGSYIRALDYLGDILREKSQKYSSVTDVFSIDDIETSKALYTYVCEQQALGKKGIFANVSKPSYWEHRFYSSALKDYTRFLLETQKERK
ncbi:MAG: hypothetical protein FWG50_10910 [Kiritimatiellaeota bacterium]|nr:hypothetical protein [Kiritimatiellota bacterium]